jgi:hypothetical protein
MDNENLTRLREEETRRKKQRKLNLGFLNAARKVGIDALDEAERFLEKGAFVDCRTQSGETALMAVCSRGLKDMADLLLLYGADPNLLADDGMSPIMLAAEQGHAGIVELLLEHKAQTDVIDSYGLTAFSYASAAGHQDCVFLLLNNLSIADANTGVVQRHVVRATEDSVEACRSKIAAINPEDYAWLDDDAAAAAMDAEKVRLENIMRHLAAVPIQTMIRGFNARRALVLAKREKEQSDAKRWAAAIVINSVCRTILAIILLKRLQLEREQLRQQSAIKIQCRQRQLVAAEEAAVRRVAAATVGRAARACIEYWHDVEYRAARVIQARARGRQGRAIVMGKIRSLRQRRQALAKAKSNKDAETRAANLLIGLYRARKARRKFRQLMLTAWAEKARKGGRGKPKTLIELEDEERAKAAEEQRIRDAKISDAQRAASAYRRKEQDEKDFFEDSPLPTTPAGGYATYTYIVKILQIIGIDYLGYCWMKSVPRGTACPSNGETLCRRLLACNLPCKQFQLYYKQWMQEKGFRAVAMANARNGGYKAQPLRVKSSDLIVAKHEAKKARQRKKMEAEIKRMEAQRGTHRAETPEFLDGKAGEEEFARLQEKLQRDRAKKLEQFQKQKKRDQAVLEKGFDLDSVGTFPRSHRKNVAAENSGDENKDDVVDTEINSLTALRAAAEQSEARKRKDRKERKRLELKEKHEKRKRKRNSPEQIARNKERRRLMWAKKQEEQQRHKASEVAQMYQFQPEGAPRPRDLGPMGGTAGYRPPSEYTNRAPDTPYKKSFVLGETDDLKALNGSELTLQEMHKARNADDELKVLVKNAVQLSAEERSLLLGHERPVTPTGWSKDSNKYAFREEGRCLKNSRVQDFSLLDSQVSALKAQTDGIRDKLVAEGRAEQRRKELYLGKQREEERKRRQAQWQSSQLARSGAASLYGGFRSPVQQTGWGQHYQHQHQRNPQRYGYGNQQQPMY